LSSSAKGARSEKLSRSSAQFFTMASATISTKSKVAALVATGSMAAARRGAKWRSNMPSETGRPSIRNTCPITLATGMVMVCAAPR
jgi:hypothetical protein